MPRDSDSRQPSVRRRVETEALPRKWDRIRFRIVASKSILFIPWVHSVDRVMHSNMHHGVYPGCHQRMLVSRTTKSKECCFIPIQYYRCRQLFKFI